MLSEKDRLIKIDHFKQRTEDQQFTFKNLILKLLGVYIKLILDIDIKTSLSLLYAFPKCYTNTRSVKVYKVS